MAAPSTDAQSPSSEHKGLLDEGERPIKQGYGDHKAGNEVLSRSFRRFRLPTFFAVCFELLFCVFLECWSHASVQEMDEHNSAQTMSRLPQVGLLIWGTFGFCFFARLFLVLVWWCKGSNTCDSVFAAVYAFLSTIQFVVYIAVYFYLYDLLSYRMALPKVAMEFDHHMGKFHCHDPYDKDKCDAGTHIDDHHCCVQYFFSVKLASTAVPPLPQRNWLPFDQASIFCVLKWLSVLVVAWQLKDMKILPASALDSDFLDGCWIDILDAVVFSSYLMYPEVIYPRHNIDPDSGRECHGSSCEEDLVLGNYIWIVWLVAFVTSLASPTLFLALRFYEREDLGDRTLDQATEDFLTQVRYLDDASAHTHCDEMLRLQRMKYQEALRGVENWHPVRVKDRSLGYPLGSANHQGSGRYKVLYTEEHNSKTSVDGVMLDKLEPTLERHAEYCGPKCCWGWCSPSYLSSKHSIHSFERKARFFDSVRSLLFLELPFCACRLYFDVYLGSNISMLFLKNCIWSFADALTILACGNTAATVLTFAPIEKLENVLKGTKLASIWVGPAGLFRIATDLVIEKVNSIYDSQKFRLQTHKAWLIMEREAAEEAKDAEAIDACSVEIARLEYALRDVAASQASNHI